MGAIGRWLRKNILNPAKTIMSQTPVGKLMDSIVPGALDPRVNLFADPTPTATPLAVPAAASVATGMTTIPTQMLQALVAEARAAQVLRTQVAALTGRTVIPLTAPPPPNVGTRTDPNVAAMASIFRSR